jgi:pilus assembly protein CpaB
VINSRTLLLLAIALVLAFASVLIAQHWVTGLQPPTEPPASQAMETIPVVVASLEIKHLSKIRDLDIKVINFPKDTFPVDPSVPGGGFNYFRDPSEVIGKIVTQTIYPGELLARQRVREQTTGGFLANYLDAAQHMRAISVRVNDVTGVSGFILPMDRVDLMLIHKRPGTEAILYDVVVQDVKVLAMDQSVSPDDSKPFLARTATLELKPLDATRVLKAAETGTLQLLLRSPKDIYPLQALIPARDPAGVSVPASPTGKPSQRGSTRIIAAGVNQQQYLCTATDCALTTGFAAREGGLLGNPDAVIPATVEAPPPAAPGTSEYGRPGTPLPGGLMAPGVSPSATE